MNGGKLGIEVLLVALAARMNRWAVGGRRYHLFVFFSASRSAATTGQSASEFRNLVVALLNTPVRPVWSCGAVLADTGRLLSDHRRNHTHAHLSAQIDNGSAMTRSDFTAMA